MENQPPKKEDVLEKKETVESANSRFAMPVEEKLDVPVQKETEAEKSEKVTSVKEEVQAKYPPDEPAAENLTFDQMLEKGDPKRKLAYDFIYENSTPQYWNKLIALDPKKIIQIVDNFAQDPSVIRFNDGDAIFDKKENKFKISKPKTVLGRIAKAIVGSMN